MTDPAPSNDALPQDPASQDPVVLDPHAQDPAVPDPAPAADKKVDDVGDPAADHPRFKEVWGKMKGFERQLLEKDDDIVALREHNKQLASSISTIEENTADANRPDPVEDPEGFAKWTYDKVERNIKRQNANTNDSTNKVIPAADRGTASMDMLIAVQEGIHDDYNEVLGEIKDDIVSDSVLRNEIYGSANPPAAAYKYGKEKRTRAAAVSKANKDKGYVEGGGPATPVDNDATATPAQEMMAKRLGIPIANYMKQAQHINKVRGEAS